jgi:hypothetical protein
MRSLTRHVTSRQCSGLLPKIFRECLANCLSRYGFSGSQSAARNASRSDSAEAFHDAIGEALYGRIWLWYTGSVQASAHCLSRCNLVVFRIDPSGIKALVDHVCRRPKHQIRKTGSTFD